MRRHQISLQPEIDSSSTLSVIPNCDREIPDHTRTKNESENPNSQVIDISQNDFTDEILPLILSSQQSSPLTISTTVDVLTLSRDPLTGMLDVELIRHNSNSSSEGIQGVQEFTNSVTSQLLFEKPRHPPQEGRNDSS